LIQTSQRPERGSAARVPEKSPTATSNVVIPREKAKR
jgi:hypothetical protein